MPINKSPGTKFALLINTSKQGAPLFCRCTPCAGSSPCDFALTHAVGSGKGHIQALPVDEHPVETFLQTTPDRLPCWPHHYDAHALLIWPLWVATQVVVITTQDPIRAVWRKVTSDAVNEDKNFRKLDRSSRVKKQPRPRCSFLIGVENAHELE